MDRSQIVQQLKEERSRIEHAISALEGTHSHAHATAKPAPAKTRKSGGITPAGRRKLSQMMKARWAARKKAAKK